MTTGFELGGLSGLGSLGGAKRAAASDAGSRLSESFADIFAQMLEKARSGAASSPADSTAEAERLTNRSLRLMSAFGAGGEYAGQSIDQLADGLSDDFKALAGEFGKVCEEHGVNNATLVGGGGVFSVVHAVDPVAEGLMSSLTSNGVFQDSRVQKNWEKYLTDLDAAQENAAGFQSALSDKSGEWAQEMELLMARSVLVREGGRVEGLKEEFLANPEEVIKRYVGQIDSAVNQSLIHYKDGRISMNF